MGYSKDGSIEIDVSLNMEQIDRDFDQLVKEAKASVKSVVRVSADIATAMEETGTGARQAGQEIEKASKGMENSLEKAEESAEGLKKETQGLGEETEKTSREQEDLGDQTEKTRQTVDKSRESFLHWGDVAKASVKGVAIVAGTLFAAMGAGTGAAISFGTEYQKASNHIQASTGATKEEMESLKNVMSDVYANNFGEDMNDVADAVANVKRNIGGTDEEIRDATEAALGFRDAFGYEVQESTRAAKALMDNFGISAKDAYDLMAKGAQNGLDYSGELIDNINEYSVQFGKAGLSAEDMFNIMQSGAESGAWNLDKIGDAVKELNIRLVDGSDTTAAGLEAIGMNADEVAKKMSQGGDTARETYRKVIQSLSEMDDKQAQNIAGVNLFGTMWEDLGPEVISHLADVDGAYSKAKGTMEEINKVQYDDAGAALETLKRKAETSLLLPISEDIMPAVSAATNAAIGYMEQLAAAYETEGVNGLVEEAGEIFADIATNAAEKAPEMVNVAADFIEQMVSGFKKNNQRLTKAGADMVKAIAGAAVKMLPKELQEPVEDAVDDLVDSLTGGGIKNGLKTFGRMFENGFKVVTKVTKAVLPPFVKIVDKTADHLDVLIPLVAAGAAAFETYSIVSSVTDNMKKLSTVTATLTALEQANALQTAAATGALGLKEIAVGLVTGKITLATAATAAWNAVMNANPIGLLVTGVVAAGAALATYCLVTDEGAEKTGQLSQAEQELKEKVDAQYESYQKLREEREQQFNKIQTEYANTQALADELQTIVDENGKIKSGYEDRAAVITGLLSEALGIEIEITDGVIQKYEELQDSIDEVILKKKAEAVQSAMQDDYTEAINKQTEAYMDYANAQKNVEKTTEELKEAQKKQQEIQDTFSTLNTRTEFVGYANELREAKKAVSQLEEKQKDQQNTLRKSEDTYLDYVTTIENYEGIVGAIASGEADQLEEASLRALNSFITAESGTKESLEKQVAHMKKNYEELKKAVETGAPGVTEESVKEMKKLVDLSEKELAKFESKARKQGEKGGKAYGAGTASKEGDAKIAGNQLATAASVAMGAADTASVGAQVGLKYSSGISGKKGNSQNAGNQLATAASIAMGAADTASVGAQVGMKYSAGISGKTGDSRNAGNQLANSARAGANVDSSDLGRNFGQGYVNGITAKVGAAAAAGAQIAASALAAVKRTQNSNSPSKKTDKLGQDFDQGYINAIVRLTSKAVTAAGNMGKKSIQALQERIKPMNMEFDVESTVREAEMLVNARIASYAEPRYPKEPRTSQRNQKKEGDVHQTINIYGDTKSPVQISRALRKEGRRLAFQK